jgi:hypothetical protein
MTTSLTDRYVHATTRELPGARRAEIGRELRASIADEVDGRVAAGEPADQAEYAVINELGDPMRLAASYTGRPLALIGPAAYPAWRRLLVLLLTIVVPIIAIVAGVAAVLDDRSFAGVMGEVWVTAITVAVHLAVWVTVVYAVLERAGVFDPKTDGAGVDGATWTPEQLPALVDAPQVTRGETVAAVLWYAVLIAYIVYQQAWFDIDGEDLPILDPDLWSSWIPVMLIALAGSVVLTILIGVRRRVTWGYAWVNLALATAFAAPVIWLAVDDRLLNPEFVAHFDWMTENVDSVNTAIAAVAALAWGLDVFDKFRRAWRSSAF